MNNHSTNIDVSIVILNNRVKYYLEQTIRSAQEALTGLNGEIIVVDNNSGDDSISHIRECFPEVIIIENDYNAGFGKANNQAFAIATGNYTLILNPDTIIGEKTIKECIRFYELWWNWCEYAQWRWFFSTGVETCISISMGIILQDFRLVIIISKIKDIC